MAAHARGKPDDPVGRAAGSGEPAPETVTRIMLRPVASSLPPGFLAFGVGTVLLTALKLHWVPLPQTRSLMLLVLVLAFVAPLEILAGVFAFLARDSGAATGLTLLGAAWAYGSDHSHRASRSPQYRTRHFPAHPGRGDVHLGHRVLAGQAAVRHPAGRRRVPVAQRCRLSPAGSACRCRCSPATAAWPCCSKTARSAPCCRSGAADGPGHRWRVT